MGKRGPRALPKEQTKSVTVGIRMTPALRQQLEAAAAADHRKLGQEIEIRLKRSFDPDQLAEQFHDRRTYYLAEIIDDAISGHIEHLARGHVVWESAYAFDELKTFMDVLLRYLRPKGRGSVPKVMADIAFYEKGDLGSFVAAVLLNQHRAAAKGWLSIPSNRQINRRVARRYPSILTQIARSGKSPLELFATTDSGKGEK